MDPRERLNDREEAIRVALDAFQSRLHTSLPGVVVSYDRTKMTAVIQPTIMFEVRDQAGTWRPVKLPVIPDVPVQWPGGGGFSLTFPLAAGDEGWLVFSERCIDAWWQLGGTQVQAEHRMHDLSDAMFLPKVRSLPKVLSPNPSATTVQLRRDDGTTYVEVTPSGDINLVSTDKVNIVAPNGIIGSISRPNFSAYATATQSIPSAVSTKMILGTVVFDSDGCFVGSRFTPTIPGKYLFGGAVLFIPQTTAHSFSYASIYMNSAETFRGSDVAMTSNVLNQMDSQVAGLLQMNGTTDFVELFATATYPSGMLTGAGQSGTYFWGTRIGP